MSIPFSKALEVVIIGHLAAVILPIPQILHLVTAAKFLADSPLGVANVLVLNRKLELARNVKVLAKVVKREEAVAADVAKRQLGGLAAVVQGLGLGGLLPPTATTSSPVVPGSAPPAVSFTNVVASQSATQTPITPTVPISTVTNSSALCLDSSVTELQINSILNHGGPGTSVFLCPLAVILISNPILFTAVNQTITTLGMPVNDTRATIRIIGAIQSNAITGSCPECSNAALRNIQVDGSRPALGWIPGVTSALLEMGGSNSGHVIDNVHAYEPRGWSTAHLIEGTGNSCFGATFTNNQIGPAGNSPTGAQQQKREIGSYGVGEWSDGISLACKESYVAGNTITDATDGGIVIFGAPGSVVYDNIIVSNTRVLMGGINMVDWAPFAGSFNNTLVKDNFIFANTTMIKVGIALGTLVWGSIRNPAGYTYGGTVTGNAFSTGSSNTPGYFGYGLPVGGHYYGTVLNNSFKEASFGGAPSSTCTIPLPPTPGPLYIDPTSTGGGTLQPGYSNQHISFLICNAPTTVLSIFEFSSNVTSPN
ncbi:hypothetical protein RQP46_003054 [Phenoliferia psychrophenolica]